MGRFWSRGAGKNSDTEDEEDQLHVYRTDEIFVAGGTPTETYNPRASSRIETEIERFLAETGKALTVYGPSKCGKTSLVENTIPRDQCVWIEGQDIDSIDGFWSHIAGELGVPISSTAGSSTEDSREMTAGIGIGVPKVAHLDLADKDGSRESATQSANYETPLAKRVRERLKDQKKTLVIDDFHYINDSAKKAIARAIKSIVRHSPVILIAVPSEAFEVVTAEPEMNLRVWTLKVPHWEIEELIEIARTGFDKLNVSDPGMAVATKIAKSSYSSPYIMQQLCLDIIRWENGVKETCPRDKPLELEIPTNFPEFLQNSAERTPWRILRKLLDGPPYSNRVTQRLKDGNVATDIYGAVMVAIKNLTPPLSHTEYEVYLEVIRVCSTAIQSNQVTSALEGLHKIADRERGDSDPVLRRRDKTLFIEDSGFAFYLNHGKWSPAKPALEEPPALDI